MSVCSIVMPHVILPAPSGRAKCRACKQSLPKAELRLGEEVPNAFGEGTATHWYHLGCGARRRPAAFLEAWAACQESLAASEHPPDAEQAKQWTDCAQLGIEFYRLCRFVRVESSPSGRARCQGCRELIDKGALRFALERIEDGMVSGAGFVHIGCAHAYAGAAEGIVARVTALSDLSPEQWEAVRQALATQAQLPRQPPQPAAQKSANPAET